MCNRSFLSDRFWRVVRADMKRSRLMAASLKENVFVDQSTSFASRYICRHTRRAVRCIDSWPGCSYSEPISYASWTSQWWCGCRQIVSSSPLRSRRVDSSINTLSGQSRSQTMCRQICLFSICPLLANSAIVSRYSRWMSWSPSTNAHMLLRISSGIRSRGEHDAFRSMLAA